MGIITVPEEPLGKKEEQKLSSDVISLSFFSRVSLSLNRLLSRVSTAFKHPQEDNGLSDIQKTAVFFLSLPPEATARLISTLSSNEIRHITTEMRMLAYVTPTAQKEVMREFCGFLLEDGKLPTGSSLSRETVHHIADRDPKGIMGILRRHWLTPKLPPALPRETVEKFRPEDRAAVILSRLPGGVMKKILPQLSPDEISRLGKGMLQLPSVPDDIQQQVWNGLSRWFRGNLDDQESLVKGIHHLLQDEGLPDYPPPLDYPEKAAYLLRLLKPKESKEIGKKMIDRLERSEQELFILALRQNTQELAEKERNQILEEFFSFVKCAFVPHNSPREEEILEEVERLGLQRPKDVAQCLEANWLARRNPLGEWREMAEKHPGFAAQQMASFLQQKGRRWETINPLQKAAIFLRFIHPEIRAEIVKSLGEENHNLINYEMEKKWRVPAGERRAILQEFLGQYYFQSTSRLLESSNSGN